MGVGGGDTVDWEGEGKEGGSVEGEEEGKGEGSGEGEIPHIHTY